MLIEENIKESNTICLTPYVYIMQKSKPTITTEPKVKYDFSTSQWLGADLEKLQQHLVENIHLIAEYPEREAETLTRLLSRRLEVPEQALIVTDGATGAYHLVANEKRGAKSVILPPTNSEIGHALERAGHEVIRQEEVTELSKLPLEDVDYLWLSNPNSPDGRFFSRRALLTLLREHPTVTVVVDLSMSSFVLEDNIKASDIKKYPNLVTISSFSKAYNLAGLRVGYVVAKQERIVAFHNNYTPRCVGSLGLEAARYVLLHPAQFTIPIRKWLSEADELARQLGKLEMVMAHPSHTPFFILELEGVQGSELAHFLLEKHKLKVGTSEQDLQLKPNQIRITALPSYEANSRLFDAIESFFTLFYTAE